MYYKLQQQIQKQNKPSINLPLFFRKIRHKSTYNYNFSSKDIVYFISFIDISYLKQGTQLKKLLDYSHFSLGCQRNSKLRWARSLLNKPGYLKELLSLSLFYSWRTFIYTCSRKFRYSLYTNTYSIWRVKIYFRTP